MRNAKLGRVVRSGTSPAPNYAEAGAAENKRHFIRKPGIALKELRESRCRIKWVLKSRLLPEPRMADLLDEAEQLCIIVGKSIVRSESEPRKVRPQQLIPTPMILQFAVLISPFSMTECALPAAQTKFRYILNCRSPKRQSRYVRRNR